MRIESSVEGLEVAREVELEVECGVELEVRSPDSDRSLELFDCSNAAWMMYISM
jgi:hypothetical protein